jgi:hypothetical protein
VSPDDDDEILSLLRDAGELETLTRLLLVSWRVARLSWQAAGWCRRWWRGRSRPVRTGRRLRRGGARQAADASRGAVRDPLGRNGGNAL